ncbi:MAG: phytoene/squalene synthase family protein [Hyphomicrobiaceae bacterium]
MHEDLVAFSRERIEKGSKSFAIAARLFAPDTRASAYMLYAWCRHCDDEIDGQNLGFADDTRSPRRDTLLSVVQELKRKTMDACEGQATEPVFQALSVVCKDHAIPSRHPLDLIAGFNMDAQERTYVRLEDTLEYCYHVAGVVGVMMSMIMGVRDRDVLLRAADLGLAFQLTNIARDVIPDHAVGRVYLPSKWLHEADLSHDNMARPENRAALFTVVNRLLNTAEPYYKSATNGIPHLPFRSAWAVASARGIYREIGTEVRRLGPKAWDERASTNKLQKLTCFASGFGTALTTRASRTSHALSLPRDGLWTSPNV